MLLPAEEITDPDEVTKSQWIPDLDDDSGEDFYAGEAPTKKAKTADQKKPKKSRKKKPVEAMSEDSEEDDTITLENPDQM